MRIIKHATAAAAAPTTCWNPADADADVVLFGANTIANVLGNTASNIIGSVRSTTGHGITGDWQAEFICLGVDNTQMLGLANASADLGEYPGKNANSWSYYANNGQAYTSNVGTAYGATWARGDVIGLRFNAGVLTFYKNGVSQGPSVTLGAGTYYLIWGPATVGDGNRYCNLNTGQRVFVYPISGSTAWG